MDEAVLAEVDDAGAEIRIPEDVALLDVVKRVSVGRGCVSFAHRKVAAGTADSFPIVCQEYMVLVKFGLYDIWR